ncbi:MAG: inositol monophosphatase family protein [Acidimicrobiales bacterium]
MEESSLLELLGEAGRAVAEALSRVTDWGLSGQREDQYSLDLVADSAALEVLHGAGLGVLSEESGLTHADAPLLAVLDPVDGSTNASRGVPWYATSICVLDEEGPLAALVVNQASGWSYEAVRGAGATRDGRPIRPSGAAGPGHAIVGVSGLPRTAPPWWQTRALGAAALDLCAVAEGLLDGFCSYGAEGLGPWDYLGGLLVCQEAGAVLAEAAGQPLVARDPAVRRHPVAAATPELLGQLVRFRKIG